jgi:hypothetical protein
MSKMLVDVLEQIKNQITATGTSSQGQWLDLLTVIADNLPADAAAPGVVRLATEAEAAAGTLTDAAVTPAGLAGAIAAVVGVLPASTTLAGSVELATSAETITGTDTERAVTPKAYADAFAAGFTAAVQIMPDAVFIATKGPVLVAPDASKHRVIVANDGTLSSEVVA